MTSAHGQRSAVATGLIAQVLAAALVALLAPRLVVSTLHASAPTLLEGAAAGAALYLVLRRVLAPASALAQPTRSFAVRGLAVTLIAWAEETLWRGVLLGVLSARGTAFALLLSTAGFAASHVYGQGWAALRTHALTGITFGGLYVATGSLAAAIAAHAVYNLFVVAARPRVVKGALS